MVVFVWKRRDTPTFHWDTPTFHWDTPTFHSDTPTFHWVTNKGRGSRFAHIWVVSLCNALYGFWTSPCCWEWVTSCRSWMVKPLVVHRISEGTLSSSLKNEQVSKKTGSKPPTSYLQTSLVGVFTARLRNQNVRRLKVGSCWIAKPNFMRHFFRLIPQNCHTC